MSEELLQGTEEWLQARVGKVTASRMGDVTARTKTGYGASRSNYMAELICERLTNTPYPQYQSAPMKWGTETEPLARAAYEFHRDVEITPVGFIVSPLTPMSGASPDGLVGEDGLVEFKCPNTATHIETLLGGSVDKEYLLQMQWQMYCTERSWCDFVSFDPRMPPSMQIHITRVARNDPVIAGLIESVGAFLHELDEKMDKLLEQYAQRREAA